jgi:hypothetical protein
MAKNPLEDNNREDADATAYVSAQRGAPLPMDFSEDTVVNVKKPKKDLSPSVESIDTDQVTRVFPVEDTTVVISDSTAEPKQEQEVKRGKTTEVMDATVVVSGKNEEIDESTTMAGKAAVSKAIPTMQRTIDLTAKASEQAIGETEKTAFQEKIKPFDPTSGNEQFREQGIREVVTTQQTNKRKTVIANDPSLAIKTARTSEQAWKKNQQRSRQTKVIFGVLVLSMAALGASAAYLVATLPG